MNKLGRVDIDLAKNVFQLHGVDRHGNAVWRQPFSRCGLKRSTQHTIGQLFSEYRVYTSYIQ
jgi:hypothetical protein